MFYALIMAGGSGTRLWPLSRQNHPKQMLKPIGERSMFQHALDRLAPLFQPQQVFVVAGGAIIAGLMEQAPDLPPGNFIVEPEGRGTAPAVGLGAIALARHDPQAVMAVLTADHFIADTQHFRQVLAAAQQLAGQGHLVTLGIKPSSPFTGYGYIKQGQDLGSVEGFPAFRVERFTEKPNQDLAVQMVQSGHYSWNSGMFIWRVDRILEEFQLQMPAFYAQLQELQTALGTAAYPSVVSRLWPQVTKQTIDYGVMEGARDTVVIPVEMGWSDIGSWTSLVNLLPVDSNGNACTGQHIGIDTHDSLIFGNGRLIATIGVQDLIIVDTEDALLICPKEREQEVRELVKRLKENNLTAWL